MSRFRSRVFCMHTPRSKQANKCRAAEARVVHMQGTSNRSAYFPRGLWFNPYDGAPAVDATEGGRYVSVSVRASHNSRSSFVRVTASPALHEASPSAVQAGRYL